MRGRKTQWLVISLGVLLVIGLYSLPKVVVSQKEVASASSNGEANRDSAKAPMALGVSPENTPSESHSEEPHTESVHGKTEISAKGKSSINNLKLELSKAAQQPQKLKLALQLAEAWDKEGRLDSAAHWFTQVAQWENTEKNWVKAADKTLDAATLSEGETKTAQLNKARSYYEKAMAVSKQPNTIKARLAMTWVETETPMQAIALLREVVAAEPENETALYNLGVLSIQSKQFERAVGRFEKVVTVNPKNLKAWFYLALSYKETGKKEEAIKAFQHLKKMDSDPVVQSTVSDYLKELGAIQ